MAHDSSGPPASEDAPHPVIAWREALLADGHPHPAHDLAPTARLVGLGLSMHARRSMKAWPSAAVVAVRCGLEERSVRRGFDALESAGWIAAEVRGGRVGGARTTTWRLTTPDSVSEVTPDRKSEVTETTPDSKSTTSDSEALTPDRESDELEELDELERAAPADLAHALVKRAPEEAALVVEAAMVRWGSTRVSELVRAYAVAGTQFLYASHLAARLDQDAPQSVRSVSMAPLCRECNGSGMVLPLGASVVERCPSCATGSAVAS